MDEQMFLMKSNQLEVVEILKNTKAQFFKDLKVGDRIQCSIPIQGTGTNMKGSTYASYITITNLKTNESIERSFNQIQTLFSNFEFKEIK